MFHSFDKHEKDANNKEPVNKEYSDSELFQALKSLCWLNILKNEVTH
jgi:hypothetical protein